MKDTYSLYEAKAKLSEIVRAVRERGRTATITYHGKPVAEIRPIEQAEENSLDARIKELRARGAIQGGRSGPFTFPPPIAKVPGALKRFLEDR